MPNVVQILRSFTPGARPVGRAEGEIYVNFADMVIGVVDAAGQPIDLTNIGDFLPLTGGEMSGPIDFAGAGGGGRNFRLQIGPAVNVFSIGWMDPAGNFQPKLSLGEFSSAIHGTDLEILSAMPSVNLIRTVATVERSLNGTSELGDLRWRTVIGDATPEVGGNTGSNFYIAAYDDGGSRLYTPFTIERGTGIVNFEVPPTIAGLPMASGNPLILDGVGATPFVDPTLPGDNATIALNKAPLGANDIIGAQNGSTRWTITPGNDAPESGGNQGSDFSINRWDDTGKHLGPAIKIARQTGVVTFDQPPEFANGATPFLPTAGGVMEGPIDFAAVAGPLSWRVQAGPAAGVFSIGSVEAGVHTPVIFTSAYATTFTQSIETRGGSIAIINDQLRLIRSYSTSARWDINLGDVTPETGNNTGADFSIARWRDADVAPFGIPLHISRATGKATFETMPSIPGGLAGEVIATDGAGNLAFSSALQDQITQLSQNLLFVGSIDVTTDIGDYTTGSGLTDGPLPAPAAANAGFYVINTVEGVALLGNIPAATYAIGDWIVSDGTVWMRLPIGQPASVPYLPLAGGVMTGPIDFSDDWRIISGPINGDFAIGQMNAGVFAPSLFFSGAPAPNRYAINYGSFHVYGDPGEDVLFEIRTPSGFESRIDGMNIAARRWSVVVSDNTPETGGNTGSNFAIRSWDDTPGSAPTNTPLSIERATGLVTIPNLATTNMTLDMGRF